MKIIQMKCPSCGGSLEVKDNLERFYCQYCGQQIILAEQDKMVVGAKMFNSFLEHRERMFEKKAAEKREREERENRETNRALIGAAIFILIMLALGIFLSFMSGGG